MNSRQRLVFLISFFVCFIQNSFTKSMFDWKQRITPWQLVANSCYSPFILIPVWIIVHVLHKLSHKFQTWSSVPICLSFDNSFSRARCLNRLSSTSFNPLWNWLYEIPLHSSASPPNCPNFSYAIPYLESWKFIRFSCGGPINYFMPVQRDTPYICSQKIFPHLIVDLLWRD